MAKQPVQRTSSAAPRFGLRFLPVIVLVALVAAGAVAGWAEWRLRRDAEASAGAGEVDAAARAQGLADAQRLDELALAVARLAGHPDLPTALATRSAAGAAASDDSGEEPAPIPLLEDVLDRHQVELVVAHGLGGGAPLRAGGPEEAGRALAASELAERAAAEGRAQGAWAFGDRLYLAAAERVAPGLEPRGVVAVADQVGRATVLQAQALGRADAIYLAPAGRGGGDPGEEGDGAPAASAPAAVLASTLAEAADAELLAVLGPPTGAGPLAAALAEGEPSEPVEVTLSGRAYRAVVAPIEDSAGRPVAARVTLVPRGSDVGLLRAVQAVALAGGAAALVLGLLATPLASRGAGRPWREITAAAEAARAGDLAGAARHRVPGPLAEFFGNAAEKRALEAVVASAGRRRPGAADRPAERRRGAVLVVDMPRYGRTAADAEPREVAERLGRDHAAIRRAVSAREGRVEAALGHRVLATFGGERATALAAGAAAEILRSLSEPENAFDQPVPPALALATGEFVLGGPEGELILGGAGGARAVTGLPVQQAEGLLREASSGDLVLSQAAYRELEGALGATGLQVTPQRGLLTPQPVYLLDAERAGGAAAALGTGQGAAAGGLGALVAGTVLADRFVLVERLTSEGAEGGATGEAAVLFAAEDRETGALVAVRALRRELMSDPDVLTAFDSDLRRVRQVVHRSVARVLELGVSEGVPFLAAELAGGPSLARVLAGPLSGGAVSGGAALPAPAALRVARGVAAGLAAIHGAGLAHGALRPESVLLDPRGHARLTGLGLAALFPAPGIDPAVDAALHGGAGRYLAPERKAAGPPTPAADVYAAGALLAEAFSGQPQVPDATELPDGLAQVLAKCLVPEPEARYADGSELAAALAPIRANLVAS